MRLANEQYFHWLCDKIGIDGAKGRDYFKLCRVLHSVEFIPLVDHDENRVTDGIALRKEYESSAEYSENNIHYSSDCSVYYCTFLEMICALCFRIVFEVSDYKLGANQTYWFLEILHNLGLEGCTDEYFDEGCYEVVLDACKRVNERTYESDGKGGLFPLFGAPEDAREMEIYYQMSLYMYENYY